MFTRISSLLLIGAFGCMSRGAPANDQASATAQTPAAPAPAAPVPAPATAAAPATAEPAPASSSTSTTTLAPGPGDKAPAPQTEAECKSACNGTWGRHGLSPKDSCNCRTSDGGKRCRDGNECEGQCVADETPELDVKEKGPPALGYVVGRCSDSKQVFGCRRFIRDGAASGPPRDLSKLPPKLCID